MRELKVRKFDLRLTRTSIYEIIANFDCFSQPTQDEILKAINESGVAGKNRTVSIEIIGSDTVTFCEKPDEGGC